VGFVKSASACFAWFPGVVSAVISVLALAGHGLDLFTFEFPCSSRPEICNSIAPLWAFPDNVIDCPISVVTSLHAVHSFSAPRLPRARCSRPHPDCSWLWLWPLSSRTFSMSMVRRLFSAMRTCNSSSELVSAEAKGARRRPSFFFCDEPDKALRGPVPNLPR